jgi:hypothetical protein
LILREGMPVQISHEEYIEGSPGVVNRNLLKVELTGNPPLKGQQHRYISPCCIECVF